MNNRVWILLSLLAIGRAHAEPVQPTPAARKSALDHFDAALWDRLLKQFVDENGRVDYARLRASKDDRAALETLYAEIARQDVERLPSKNAKEAFYINAYNVIVWKGVVDESPQSVDRDGFAFFKRQYLVGGRARSLDDLEKRGIHPVFHDARVHMALNCASTGCPPLAREALTPERLDQQLDAAARAFCNTPRGVRYDAAAKTVFLSMLFHWYETDFAPNPIAWINACRAKDAQIPSDSKVAYVEYDWRLNDKAAPR